MNPIDDETGTFLILINEEGQYSLWPTFKNIPNGWKTEGPRGSKKECLQWIEDHWQDMRPLTLVRQMNETSR
jgi:MbtH protein